MTGELDQGRAATREGLSWSQDRNQRYLEAELGRVDGELAYLSGEAEDAAASLRNALELASAQGRLVGASGPSLPRLPLPRSDGA